MFTIQCFDYDEGSCARWHDLTMPYFETREQARMALRTIRAKDSEDEYLSYAYRITEVGSDQYYSQPTDSLEY